jgi:hypothetical protein
MRTTSHQGGDELEITDRPRGLAHGENGALSSFGRAPVYTCHCVCPSVRRRAPSGVGKSFGLPRRLPRALAAFRAADVRALMISRSRWATAAKIWIVNLFAFGLSTAMNSTPESISVAINVRLRERRSSSAITSLARPQKHPAHGALALDRFKNFWRRNTIPVALHNNIVSRVSAPRRRLRSSANSAHCLKCLVVVWICSHMAPKSQV